jgi:hypothetical protein
VSLADRIASMARSVRPEGYPVYWPAWSTGELLLVALVLNDHRSLSLMGYTMVEAFDRVDLDAATLRRIERELRDAGHWHNGATPIPD